MILPYPPSVLNPNVQKHWAVKDRARKKYLNDCYIIAKTEKPRKKLTIIFFPPDNRKRDRDNAIAAFKAGQDAIAKAWDMDDSEFEITYKQFGEPVKGGQVVVV